MGEPHELQGTSPARAANRVFDGRVYGNYSKSPFLDNWAGQFGSPVEKVLTTDEDIKAANSMGLLSPATTDNPIGTLRYGGPKQELMFLGHMWHKSWQQCVGRRGLHHIECQKARYYAESMFEQRDLEPLDADWERNWGDPFLGQTGYLGSIDYSLRKALARSWMNNQDDMDKYRSEAEEEGIPADEISHNLEKMKAQWMIKLERVHDKVAWKKERETQSDAAAFETARTEGNAKESRAARFLRKAKAGDKTLAAYAGSQSKIGTLPVPSKESWKSGDLSAFYQGVVDWADQNGPYASILKDLKEDSVGDSANDLTAAVEVKTLRAQSKGKEYDRKQALDAIEKRTLLQGLCEARAKFTGKYTKSEDLASLDDTRKESSAEFDHSAAASLTRLQVVTRFKNTLDWRRKYPGAFLNSRGGFSHLPGGQFNSRNCIVNNLSMGWEAMTTNSLPSLWSTMYGEAWPLNDEAGVKKYAENDSFKSLFTKKLNGLYNHARRTNLITHRYGGHTSALLPRREINYENPGAYEYQTAFGTRIIPDSKYFPGRTREFDFEDPTERKYGILPRDTIPRLAVRNDE